jgi:RHS repeat-associated protein
VQKCCKLTPNFTGKEELPETGYTDFGARLYDNLVPRFISIDPLAEIARRFSPYTYANDNPVRFIDPDGMATDEHFEGAEAQQKFSEEKEKDAQRKDDKDKGKTQKNETSQGPYAHPVYSNISKNKSVVAGYTAGYNKDDKYGSVQGNVTGFRAEYFDYTGTGTSNLAIETGVKATGLQATTTMRAGTENNNLQANVEGNALLGEANLSAGYFSGENNKKGLILGAEAGVYGLRGEFNPSVSMFGYKFGFTLGGSLGSAQVGAGLGAYRDTNKGTH